MKMHTPIFLVLLIALFGTALFNWSSYGDKQRGLEAQQWVTHSHQTIRHLDDIRILVSSNESSMRGYAITENKALIIDYSRNCSSIINHIDSLHLLFNDNPAQQERLEILKGYVKKKINFEIQVINAAAISPDSARLTISSLQGKKLMNLFSGEMSELKKREEQLLQDRTNSAYQSASNSFKTTIIFSIIAFLFILLILFRLNKDILLRLKTQKKLVESEEHYRRFVENAGVVSFTSDDMGCFTFTSSQAESLTGYSTDELKGKHFTELVHPEHLMKVVEHYAKQVNEQLHETTLVFPIVHKTGQMKWVEQDTILLQKEGKIIGYQSVVKDVTEKVAMDRRIQDMERDQKEYQLKVQAILDNTPLAIYVKDMEGKYILINRKFRDCFNVTDEDVIGKTIYDLHEKGALEKYLDADRQVIQTGKPIEIEDVLKFTNGVHNVLTLKFPLFDANNKMFGISGFINDISETVRYREELISARKRAETAESLQEQFLANMSHEIRTPMNGIIGMTNLLQKTELKHPQRDYVQIIKQSSDNLLVLINDILDLSKIKAGKISIEKIPFNLQSSLHSLTATFKLKAEEKNIHFSFIVHPDVPTTVKGDPYRLSQILSNLMSNAMKFTDKGSVTLDVTLKEVKDNLAHLCFKVIDTGIGIEEKNIHYIFESFAQESVSTTRKYGGTGLGLTITKQLVELQKGSIEITSEPGIGSTFSVILPFIISSNQEVSESIMPEIKPIKDIYDFSGKNVLIVEDNEINRIVLHSNLKQYNLNVTMAFNGLEAVNHLKNNPNIDLILMDLHMPEMDGYEATSYIRNELKLSIPIVILTASAMRNEKQKSVELGANEYLTKPFKPEDLHACLEQFLGTDASVINIAEPALDIADETTFDLTGLLKMADASVIRTIHTMFEKLVPESLEELKQSAIKKDWERVTFISHKLKGSLGVIRIHSVLKNMSLVELLAKERRELDTILPMVDTSIRDYGMISPMIRKHLEKEVFNSLN
jgi:PAS domain S-box-containing protein